jgi:hypothetical protein
MSDKKPDDLVAEGAVKAAYDRMSVDRQWYLTEGKASSELTIPSIMASDQDASNIVNQSPYSQYIVKPWQSVGAKGVRNLASKLGLTLFPPTGTFMRYQLHPKYELELDQPGNEDQRTQIEQNLAIRERIIMDDIELNNVRTKADQVLRLLIVTGNALVYLPPKGGMRVFPLNHYVVRRDFTGNLVELVYLEMLDKATLPANIKKTLTDNQFELDAKGDVSVEGTNKKNSVAVYTRLVLKGKRFMVSQEVEGYAVDLGSKTAIAKDKMPFLALRFVTIDGEHYGRGYVEEYAGDLRSLEELRKSIVIGSLNAAKMIPMVQPGAVVTPKKLMEAENGKAIFGRAEDVVMLQQNKHADMSVAQRTAAEIKQDLQAAFLLNSSFQRDAERVTAEEVRAMAEELEDALGGIYSVLSQELQLPLAKRTEERLIEEGSLQKLEPKDAVKPIVITGLAALGRGHEFNRNREFFAFLSKEVAPLVPDIGSYLIPRDILDRAALGLGVPIDGLVKTAEQMQQEAQDAQKMNMQQTMMEGAAPGLGEVAAQEIGGKVSAQMEEQGVETSPEDAGQAV